MCINTYTLHSLCMTSNCGASVVLLCITFAIHLSDTCHTNTHRGRAWIQASLTLNLAQADSNFCLQITFQWLHKSAASSSASFSFPHLPASLSSPLLCRPCSLSPFYSSLTSFFFPCINLYPPHLPLRLYFTISHSPPPPITCFLVSPHSFSLALAQ